LTDFSGKQGGTAIYFVPEVKDDFRDFLVFIHQDAEKDHVYTLQKERITFYETN